MTREVSVLPDAESLADAVARAFAGRLATAQAEDRLPEVALTGGTIAEEIYRRVAALESSGVDWARVEWWWGDERYVARTSEDRNELQAREEFLSPVGADPRRIHTMPASDDGLADVAAAAAAYGSELRGSGGGRFELVLLGLGPDGHVASLFPGFDQLEVDDEIAVPVTGSPKPPPERVSLTFGALNRAREVWFLVSGEGKADAVARALAEDGSVAETPARGITADAHWFLDEAAASRLP